MIVSNNIVGQESPGVDRGFTFGGLCLIRLSRVRWFETRA